MVPIFLGGNMPMIVCGCRKSSPCRKPGSEGCKVDAKAKIEQMPIPCACPDGLCESETGAICRDDFISTIKAVTAKKCKESSADSVGVNASCFQKLNTIIARGEKQSLAPIMSIAVSGARGQPVDDE